ncbi:MAG: proprotein convertase P-domain-containing protein, partial [Gemmataceae bacterium]|nr:proprotein convertase P-domain-containing protein [Gemmataceae bacterium]
NPNTNVGVSPGRLSFVWETASQPTTPITPGTAIRQNSSLPDGGDPAQEAASAANFSGPGGSFLLGISPPPAPPNIDATANLPNPVVAGAPNIYPTISPGSGNFTTTQTQSFSIFIANQAGAAVVQNGYGVVVYIYVPFGFNINTISGTDWTIVPGIQVPPDPDIPPVPYIGNGPSYNGNPGGPPQGGPFQTFTAVYTGNSSIQVIPGTPPQNITLPPITITGQFTPAAPYNFQITAMIDRANPYVNNANGIGNPGNNIDQVIYNVGSPPPDTPQSTAFPVEVDFASYPFIKPTDLVKNLTASVAINYQFMEDVDLLLVAPNGQSLQLLQNFNNENNTTNTPPRGGTTTGLPGVANLGAVGAANGTRYADTTDGTGATFDDNAPRFINDTANVSPYIGRYKPEGFLGTSPFVAGGTAGSFAELVAGMTAAEATGTWTLLVTSHRGRGNNPVPPRVMANWNLHFSFNIQNSPAIRTNPGFTAATNAVGNDGFTDRVITTAGEQRTLLGPSAAGGGALDGNQTYPIAPNPGSKIPPPVSPTLGIGPSISVAYDTSVGGPYSGRMYLVYTAFIGGADYDIALWYSDDNGASWTGDPTTGGPIIVNDDTPLDNQTEGNRTQFMPQVTTDPVTGTVAVMWYDARFDASNVRAATMLATSIDGGKTFSRNTFVNSPKQARNALDPADYITLEPIPSIILGSGPYQFGNRQGLLAHDGRILTFWTGNAPYSDENGVARSNASGGSTFTYSTLATTAAGPRVVTGDSGVVGAQAVVTDGFGNPTTVTVNGQTVATYNDTFAPDGTRQLSGFRVRFDRPILASSFTAAAVQARYQDPLTGEYFTVAVQNPVPIFPVWAQNGGTTGAYIDVNGVPWYYPAGSTDAFYVPFATPQKAVGTYSYSVGPAFNAGTGTTSGPTDTIRTGLPNWASTDTPLVIPPGALRAPTTTTSALTVSGIPAGTTLSSAAVTINIQMPQDVLGNGMQDYDLVVTLVAPDGTRVVLSDRSPRTPVGVFPPGKAPGFLLTTFDHNLENGIADSRPQDSLFVSNTAAPYWIPNAPFTGRFQPDSYTGAPTSGLGALVGKAAAGTWRLEVQNFNGQSGTVTGWSLALTDAAGEPVEKPALGNQMDQNMNGVAGEFDPAATGARADTFANPAPVDPRGVTVPFKQPFAPTTLPLIIPGPQVANVGVVVAPVTDRVAVTTSQPVKVVSTVPKVGTNSVFVVLNREVDPTSFTTAALAGVFGPTGAATVTSVAPAYASFAPDLVAGTLSVNVTFTDPTALLNPSKILSLTGPAGNVDPNTLSVAATADPATYQIFFPSAVIAGGQYTFKFTPDLVVANPGMTRNTPTRVFEVKLASPVASAVNPRLSAGVTSYDVTFATPPGTFTPANITSVVGPNGPLAGPFTVTPVSPTVFRIGFPAVPTTGNYLFTFNFPFQTAVTSFQLPGDTSATLTFPTPPPRPLTATDLVSVVGPDGAVGGPFAVVQLSPTTYRVDFPAPLQTAGYYKFTFNDNPAVDASYTVNVGLTLRPADNLVLNGVVSAIDVTFDRLIDPSSVRVANVLRITGPTGDVPLANVTVTPVLSTRDAATGGVTTFQIGFPTQLVDGPYTIQFGPDAGQPNKALASIRSAVELPTLVANLSSGATTVPVTFSANSLPTTRLPSYPSTVIQSIVAPDGTAVTVPGGTTITQTNGATSNTYQINFPAGTITQSGQYVIRFTAASGLTVFGTGPQVDTNRNAGLARLRGIDPTATVTTKTYNTPLVPGVPIASGATVNYPINVPDAFVIQPGPNPNQQIQVLMNIAFPYDPDLDIDLVAPDGTTVVLFNGSGVQGLLNQANFSNTLFTDARVTATGVPVTPISSASPPYNPFAGAFNPQLPLSNTLTGKSSQGVWNLRVTNNGNRAGTIQNWAITLPGAVPGTGMGEAVADQFQAGFRVFIQDPTKAVASQQWTPLTTSVNNSANVGRVPAVAVDPA